MSTFKNLPREIGGNQVVAFTSSKRIKDLHMVDIPSLYSFYEDDPNKAHLGLVELFTSMADYRMPMYKNFFKTGAVIEVPGVNGKLTYDLQVTRPSGIYTTGDTSTYSDYPGIDGTVFPIELDQPFTKGDVIGYDGTRGEQIVISEDYEVEQNGDSWIHWGTLVTLDPKKYFPKEKLKPGIPYYKINHSLGEYSTQYSGIQTPAPVGTLTCEFELGNHRGVETAYTMYADMKKMSGASLSSKDYMADFVRQMESLGTDSEGRPLDMFIVGQLNKATNKVDPRTARVGATLEYLVLLELMKLENFSLMFQRGGLVNDINGTKRLNEGFWHQWRRGHRIEYSVPGGITRATIKDAVAYLFQNNKTLLPYQRRIKFKCGYMAYINMLNIFREEVMMQLDGIAQLLGQSTVLPKSPVSGPNLQSLALEPIMFKEVNIPEIGIVQIEHEPALDYMPLSNREDAGMYGDGYPNTSYTMLILDARSDEYSNALSSLPANARVLNDRTKEVNFYVKPEGPNLFMGHENGRYSPYTATDIIASSRRMTASFFAHSISAGLCLDPSVYVFVELKQ